MTWEKSKNILCVRLDSMGDVLMTSPAIRALKKARRGRKITLLTSPAGAEVAQLIPEIDEVLVYEAPWMKSTPPRFNSSYDLQMIQVIKKRQFDAAVIFTVFSQSPLPAAFMAYQANIPLRLACSRENPYQLLTDWVLETEPNKNIRHEVRRQLDLVASIGCTLTDERLHIHVKQTDLSTAENVLASHLDGGNLPWLIIHPGASAPSRRYPVEGYAIVVQQLYEKYGFISVLTGGKGEVDLVEAIRTMANVPSISLAGQLTVAELAGVLSKAPLMISNNTGPAHLAASVGTPIVDLYALTNPQHAPWGVPSRVLSHDVPCKFCFKSICPLGHHNCLRLVRPARVISAVCDLLQEVGQTTLGMEVSR